MVSLAKTELILKSSDLNQTTGHDQIPTRVLQNGASVLAGPIARLINTVNHENHDNACVPAEWKLAEICPMFKRDDEFDKSKYRPVSILVLLEKGFREMCAKTACSILQPVFLYVLIKLQLHVCVVASYRGLQRCS